MQQKMAAGENQQLEMIKVFVIIYGLYFYYRRLFHRLPRSYALSAAAGAETHLTVKLMPHLRFSRMPGGGFSAGTGGDVRIGGTSEDDDRVRLDP